jgi:hypothetical protein
MHDDTMSEDLSNEKAKQDGGAIAKQGMESTIKKDEL